ncbi:MAG: DUF1178 family protein [Rhodospirillales bacterium]
MMKFSLRCAQEHEFESWFSGNDAFDRLIAVGEVTCPVCGNGDVEKALMAPRLSSSTKKGRQEVMPPEPAKAALPMDVKVRTALHELRRVVEQNCDYVGDRFAEEARNIHNGESEARGIYGEATPEETEKLADDGVEIQAIPWLPKSDA